MEIDNMNDPQDLQDQNGDALLDFVALHQSFPDSTPSIDRNITREDLEFFLEEHAIKGGDAHRIHFATIHRDALRPWNEAGKYPWIFSLPFADTIKPIFERDTHFRLFQSIFNEKQVFVGLSEEGKKVVERWIKKQGTRVFLRDCLSLSVAMDLNMQDGQRTEMGNLEYKAKYQNDEEACNTLACRVAETIRDLPCYRSADIIVPAPVSLGSRHNLLESVAHFVEKSVDKPCCPVARFTHRAQPMKNVLLEQKLDNLEAKKLVVEGDSLKGKSVILLDDKYQSGATANFVAWKLQEAGVRYVYGLFLVKTMRDTDNQ